MKSFLFVGFPCLLLSGFGLVLKTAAQPQPAPVAALAGVWQGALALPTARLQLVFSIAETSTGTRTATLTVPQQGAQALPATMVLRADSVLLAVPAAAGRFAGRLSAAGQEISGAWTQGGRSLPLVLARTGAAGSAAPAAGPAAGQAPAARRPQTPRPPFPYQAREIVVPNPGAGLQLAGTLTVPAGKGPCAAVVLITGSGPEDRNETLFGHQPFAVLADYLTRRGVAVLRLDDRGVGQSTGNFGRATTPDFAADARAALVFLRAQPGIDPQRVGLLGHSEGSLVAAIVAAQPAPPAFVVSLAGPGVPGTAILLRQKADIGRALGHDTARIGRGQRVNRQLFAVLRTTPDSALAVARMAAILPQEAPGLPAAQAQAAAAALATPWLRAYLATNPTTYWQQVRCPVLLLNGSRDLQVAAAVNLPAIAAALQAGGNRRVTTQELPGLNHLFQSSTTGLPTEYPQIEETFAPAALQIIGNWVSKQTGR